MNAAEKLAREIYRVGRVMTIYEAMGPNGRFALIMMSQSIEIAFAAAGSDDAVDVLAAIADLEGFKL